MLLAAAIQDLRSGRVPNRWIAAGLAMGLFFQIAEHSVWGVYYFLRNSSFPVILLYLLFQTRVLGAGDIKLFSMIGSILTFEKLLQCMAYSFLAAGAGAILFLVADKKRWEKLSYAANFLLYTLREGKVRPYQPPYAQERFALTVPMLYGTAFAVFFATG